MSAVTEKLSCRDTVMAVAKELSGYELTINQKLRLSEVISKVEERQSYIALVGQVKRGKSTLANAILGRSVLPMGVTPVTSVITKVVFGVDTSAFVKFGDGRQVTVALEDLPSYATEEHNPNNNKNVVEVVIRCPSEFLQDGLVLVDTPGIGSVYLNDVASTYEFLDRVDAAILTLSVDPPIGQDEVNLISKLRLYASKIFFVLNKVDYVSASERERLLEYTSKVISDAMGATIPKVFPLCAKEALEGSVKNDDMTLFSSGLIPLLREIMESISGERAQLQLLSSANHCANLISNLEMSGRIHLKALEERKTFLVERIEWLRAAPTELEDGWSVIEQQVDVSLKVAISKLDSDLDAFIVRQSGITEAFIESFLASKTKDGVDPKTLERLAEEGLEKHLNESYEGLIMAEAIRLEGLFDEMVQRTTRMLEGFLNQFRKSVGEGLGISIEPIKPVMFLRLESGFKATV